jgi:hypothetical protein
MPGVDHMHAMQATEASTAVDEREDILTRPDALLMLLSALEAYIRGLCLPSARR